MSFDFVGTELRSIVADLSLVIRRCDALGLPEVSKRLEPIRDVIQQGIELRELAKSERAAGGTRP